MVYRLFTKLISLGAIALLLIYKVSGSLAAEEYVFTAPPETNQQTEEIPASNTEYPLYECDVASKAESESESAANSETALDPHDCICTDCEELPPEKTSEPESSSQSSYSEP